MKIISSDQIRNLQKSLIQTWHENEQLIKSWEDAIGILKLDHSGFPKLVFENQLINCYQWHEEDKSRMVGVSDKFLAEVKSSIDASNQRRTDKIEEMDLFIIDYLKEMGISPGGDVPMNSETPGSMIDRLSILSLKIYHMEQETVRADVSNEHILKCKNKRDILEEQDKDLSRCFDELIDALCGGRKRLKVYYQFKMYNDPETNPALYGIK